MKAMETIQDLIEEFKLRTVWWALCIFAVSYFLSHTSKSMWMNAPIAILFVSFLRILCTEIEFRRKVPLVQPQPYLSHLEKKQLPLNDSRLSSVPPSRKWKKKIESPMVEAAMNDFIEKLLKDFVLDLWYADITPDREVPELMQAVVMEALAEVSARVREINLVDLLTKDIVDLIGEHLDLFRRNQSAIGVDVMETLSSEERDERLKYHLMSSKELHPALISSESEYKVLQQLMAGVLAIVLKPREAQCPLVRSIARELVTCLVIQPIMNLASPGYINELIESIFLFITADETKEVDCEQSKTVAGYHCDQSVPASGVNDNNHQSPSKDSLSPNDQKSDTTLDSIDNLKETYFDSNTFEEERILTRHNDWGRKLEAATQRRTEVLAPENLENLWTKGRNYKKKEQKKLKARVQEAAAKSSAIDTESQRNFGREKQRSKYHLSTEVGEGPLLLPALSPESQSIDGINKRKRMYQHLDKPSSYQGAHVEQAKDTTNISAVENTNLLKKSNSTSNLRAQGDTEKTFTGLDSGPIIANFFSPKYVVHSEKPNTNSSSSILLRNDRQHVPKLKSRVKGAYFEKLGSKSFAVYLIEVIDAENRTWFVKRRYSNFERLHRHLKDIPNYTLHLPPKRIFSSSTEDAFVHQRCIQLDKYLQDLLSIANVAEQHEVWDFLSVSSKKYSFGKSSSVMKTLAVNVDDAVDDIVRQFKGVSDGLMRKVVGPSSSSAEALSSVPSRHLPWNAEVNKQVLSHSTSESMNSLSDNEDVEKDGSYGHVEDESSAQPTGWHSDNELNLKSFPPRVVKCFKESQILGSEKRHDLDVKSERTSQSGFPDASNAINSKYMDDPVGVPPEWNPPNVTVPLLNLVDNVFQLKGRGWIRRQAFWISKQILQLVMEDAIDDWLLRQIHWLRKEETVAQGIRWVQDVLWPNGTFFIKLRDNPSQVHGLDTSGKPFQMANQMDDIKISKPGSFEEQLEAARRASDVKKMLYDGAPTALVSLIGNKQYKRCARDIYYFIQSSICVKQLAYSILELLLMSIFPELRSLVIEVREKMLVQKPV